MTIQFDVLGIGNILMDIIAPVSNDFLIKERLKKHQCHLSVKRGQLS
jgi:sugar/nucleoside kinase (ribokinase family)